MSRDYLNRYIRQIRHHNFGAESQQRLTKSRVLICGCGGLGTTLANHLVRAGVGFVRIVDRDLVDEINLHRQILFDENDAAQSLPKAIAAANRLRRVNSEVSVEPIVADVGPDNIQQLASDVDLILDGSDNFETRFLLNDVSLKYKIPWVSAACLGTQGQVFAIIPGKTPCLRCLIPEPPLRGSMPTCETAGIFGPLVGVIASIQAMEALKILAQKWEAVTHDFISIDLWPFRIRRITFSSLKEPNCPACQLGQYEYLNSSRAPQSVILCAQQSVQITPPIPTHCDFDRLSQQWEKMGVLERSVFFLRLRTPEWTLTLFPDGRAIIAGVDDVARARSIYDRLVKN